MTRAECGLIIKLLELDWIKTEEAKEDLLNIFEDEEIKVLGEGEKECILLCKEKENSILLINDRRAREIAKRKGISTLNTSAFLLLCKIRRIIDKDEIISIMESLKEKDYFEFSEEEKRILLE
jgi:predicted nucleic acid-binding protein